MNASLYQLLKNIAPAPKALERPISGLSSDSRQVQSGDLFLAVRGERSHGLDYFAAVGDANPAAIAWEPPYANLPTTGIPLIEVEQLGQHVGTIADRFYGDPSRNLDLVGITGTDGKTSCAYFIAQALSQDGRKSCGLLGTLGYGLYGELDETGLTTPDALRVRHWLAQARNRGASHAVMEVSSHALAQARVNDLRFAVAVLTNLGRDHLDYHGDLVGYAAAKRRLFEDCRPARVVLNLDDEFGRELADQNRDAVVYGLNSQATLGEYAHFVCGRNLQLGADGLRLEIVSSWGEGEITAPLMGRFNASNLLATLATLLVLQMPLATALQRLQKLSTAPGRMERFGGAEGQPLAIVDFAHTPQALEQALQALHEHKPANSGSLWCVFGCGGDRDPGKRPLMGAAAERWADHVVVTDDNPRTEDPEYIVQQILAGMQRPEQAQVLRGRDKAIIETLAQAKADDIVLIAGKGHEDYQFIGGQRIDFSDRELVQRCCEDLVPC